MGDFKNDVITVGVQKNFEYALGMTVQFNGRGGRSGDSKDLFILKILGCESPLLPPHIQLLEMSLVTQ